MTGIGKSRAIAVEGANNGRAKWVVPEPLFAGCPHPLLAAMTLQQYYLSLPATHPAPTCTPSDYTKNSRTLSGIAEVFVGFGSERRLTARRFRATKR